MIKYTNRTCHTCGARKPQPDMVRKEIYEETGKSNATISTATWIGVAVGDKASARAVKRAGFNNGERTYSRKKTIWVCRNCRAPASNYNTPPLKKVIVNDNIPKVGSAIAPIIDMQDSSIVPIIDTQDSIVDIDEPKNDIERPGFLERLIDRLTYYIFVCFGILMALGMLIKIFEWLTL